MSLTDLVNPLQGSDSRMEFSTGNTYPAMGVPRGLTYWSPQNNDTGFFFDRRAAKLNGFRATHCPSPWMDDYGHFDVFPVVGAVSPKADQRASSYRFLECSPHRMRVELLRYGTEVALCASRTGAIFQINYPAGADAALVLQTGRGRAHTLGAVRVHREEGRVVGKAMSHAGFVPENFACWFVLEIEGASVIDCSMIAGGERHEGEEISAPGAGAIIRLKPSGPVTVRVATSFISTEQACINLEPLARHSLDSLADEVQRTWEDWLSRIEADGGSDADRRTLYSCLWRAGLFPMAMHETAYDGITVHYSPHTGRVTPGVLYTNNGFWDTYRTCYTLLGLIDPAGYGEIVEGFLAHYREGGWLPKWCSPGYRDCMIGSHSDAVISEAILRGITGFDYNEAYAAIRKNAFEPVQGHNRFGRAHLDAYLRLGYLPADRAHDSVSWTLDNAHCDWCIAQVARKLGHHDDAEVLTRRAGNYRHLWHEASGFMRPRNAHGSWAEPWREFEWGGAYVEGGPWQHSLHVPHDPQGLAELHGGVDRLMARIEQMLATPPRFEVGRYGFEIHEMTEMARARDEHGQFGQYAHSNQPVHGFLWLPAQLGRPEVSAKYITRVMRGLYSPDGFAGDEDNGEMASWYLLGALGKVPDCAGSGRTVDVPVRVFDAVRARPHGRR